MTLPAPPTLEQRLDAAAAEYRLAQFPQRSSEATWDEIGQQLRAHYRAAIEPLCRAFAPEHFKDTDTTTGKD